MLLLRFPRLWLFVGWLLVVLALAVCLVPNGVPATAGLNDKAMHTVGYLGLTLWFTGIYSRGRYLFIAASLIAMGILVEILQGAMHVGREAEARDVAANVLGVVLGLGLALSFLGGWMQRIESWIVPHGR